MVLGLVSYVSLAGAAMARSNRPELGWSLPFGSGEAMAVAARREALRGAATPQIVQLSVAAVASSPLHHEPFFATSRVVPRPDLAEALLMHAHALSRRDRPMLEVYVASLRRQRDISGAVAVFDELFAQTTGPEPYFAILGDMLANPTARASVAAIFARKHSWRSAFFGQIDPSPGQVESIRLLLADMRRRGTPLPDSVLIPLVQRLSFGVTGHKVDGWRIWSTRSGADPLSWPGSDAPEAMPYSWSVPDELAGRVTFGNGALRYDIEGAAGAIVAKLTTAFPAGQYRVAIAAADARVRLQTSCGSGTTSFASGAVIALDTNCPIQALALWVPSGSETVSKVGLTPLH